MMFCTIAISIYLVQLLKMKFIHIVIRSNMDCSCMSPVAHWVWGGGWINKLGVDFAGGTVVHILHQVFLV